MINDEEPHCAECAKKPEVVHKPRAMTTGKSLVSLRKAFLKDLLADEVASRAQKGTLNTLETAWLLEWGSDERENVSMAAIKALALCAYPTEKIPGIRKHIMSTRLLEFFLYPRRSIDKLCIGME